jgi:hypothetical protein
MLMRLPFVFGLHVGPKAVAEMLESNLAFW